MMSRKLFLILFLNIVISFGLSSAAAAQQVPSASLLDQQTAEKANAHEDELYQSAKDALDNGEYDNAIKQFDEVIKIHGRRADGAMYWKAYALNKAGNKAQALTAIGELRKNYPKSNWLRDAGALEQEIRGGGNPENISDEELKLLAIQSLMNSDPEKAVPLLEKIIMGNYPPKLKDKALFRALAKRLRKSPADFDGPGQGEQSARLAEARDPLHGNERQWPQSRCIERNL